MDSKAKDKYEEIRSIASRVSRMLTKSIHNMDHVLTDWNLLIMIKC